MGLVARTMIDGMILIVGVDDSNGGMYEFGSNMGCHALVPLPMEDVIETLLGMEIVDEVDGTADMQVLARKQWELRAKRLGLLE